MKILNSRTSSTEESQVESSHSELDSTSSKIGFQTTKVSSMYPTSELHDDSLIHLVENINGKFQSRKITAHDIKQKLYEAVNNNFRSKYWETHLVDQQTKEWMKHSQIDPFKEMVGYINDKEYNFVESEKLVEVELNSSFIDHITFDFEVLRRYFKYNVDDINVRIDNTNNELNEIDFMFASSMVLTTMTERGEVTNLSVNTDTNDNSTHCQMVIPEGNKVSGSWVCPIGGMLVVYGWLDSSAALNNKGIPSSFCVLEAKINDRWEIIGVQSIIPAKTITYVGFTVPVHEGLTVRVRTGFTVGSKSGQFSNEQDGFDTLSNSTNNGFKCQIFSRKEEDNNDNS